MKLKFTAAGHMISYLDKPNWTDGTVREVDDERAAILLKDFPLNFSVSEEAGSTEAEESTEAPAAEEPTGDTPETSQPSEAEEAGSTEAPIATVLNDDLAATFETAGFATAESVLAAKPEEVMSKTGINPKTFKKVQEACHKAVQPDQNKQLGPTESR